ncbi:MAG: MBL fold metallo-hydrolase [Desulfatibacillaceae bacterium]|nr:MBL fold metallo-hydrolase [Desulfatibacillaceae bacterium]
MVRVTCLGAAGGVTGSCYLVETSRGAKLLVDCGLFQGGRQSEQRNWQDWGFEPSAISTLVLTHAHIDHCGRIPKLVKDGFSGKILTTGPSVELCEILLLDSGHIQEMNAQWQSRKSKRKGGKEMTPLYTVGDAQNSLGFFSQMERDKKQEIEPGVWLRFRNAGHILGSSIAELWVEDGDNQVKIVFSGDLGKGDQLIVRDPHEVYDADFVFMESTYGDRLHRSFEDSKREFLDCIVHAYNNGEKVIIPSFAVERTQEIIYTLGDFARAGVLPDMPIYLDSPLAIKATEIFRKNKKYFDDKAQELIASGHDPLTLPNLKYTPSTADSIAITLSREPSIVIAGNGMCTAGRIKHHLKHNLWRPGAVLVIVGFQARGTTGRRIVDGAKTVKILNEDVAVKAKVCTIGGFSAHADQADLLEWAGHFKECRPKFFLVHGEDKAKDELARLIGEKLNFDVHIPIFKESLLLKPREVTVELPEVAVEPEAEPSLDELHNILVDMEKAVRELKGKLPERFALQKDGDHDMERIRFVAEEIENIASGWR